jgi:hypothetical protein
MTHRRIDEAKGILADGEASIIDHCKDGTHDGSRSGGSIHQGELTVNLESDKPYNQTQELFKHQERNVTNGYNVVSTSKRKGST